MLERRKEKLAKRQTERTKKASERGTLTTVDAVVKAATFVTANTAQHGCTIEFWRKGRGGRKSEQVRRCKLDLREFTFGDRAFRRTNRTVST